MEAKTVDSRQQPPEVFEELQKQAQELSVQRAAIDEKLGKLWTEMGMENFNPGDYLSCTELKPVRKEGVGYGIDESPTWIELSQALATKEYKLLRLERLEPMEADTFLIKVQDTKPIDRKLGTPENPVL